MEEWGLSSNSWFNFKNILAAITKKKKKKKKKKKNAVVINVRTMTALLLAFLTNKSSYKSTLSKV